MILQRSIKPIKKAGVILNIALFGWNSVKADHF